MASKEFKFNASDLILFRRFLKKAPKLFNASIIGTLNTLAFETRTALIVRVDEQMQVRDKKFVSRSIQVLKAKGRDFRTAEAVVGSVHRARFSGWIEQETGKKSIKNRTQTLLARGNSESKKVKQKARLKRSNQIAKISDFQIKAKSKAHRLIIFLEMMRRQRKTFIMPRKYKRLKRGVYSVSKGGKKLQRIQTFGPRKVNKDPWMKPVVRGQLKQADIRKIWAQNVERMLPKRLR